MSCEDFSTAEWEALCDRCGICCLFKIEDSETEELFYTSVICPLYDAKAQGCAAYEKRFEKMETCVSLDSANLPQVVHWLPRHCAYRCLHEHRALPDWHPLRAAEDAASKALVEKFSQCVTQPHGQSLRPKQIRRIMNHAVKAKPDDDFEEQLIWHVLDEPDL